jgi:hypothetical protein
MSLIDFLINIADRFQRARQNDALIISAKMLSKLNNSTNAIRNISDAEFKVTSQWGEDGIIDWLVNAIDPAVDYFVEFGVEDYRESNTRFLLQNRNWRGLVLDGSSKNVNNIKRQPIYWRHDLTAVSAFITAENIMNLFEAACVPKHIGLLSIDIDGVDWWIAKELTIRADIIVCEYNHYLGNEPVTVPYSPSFQRLEASKSGVYYGASLAAWKFLWEARGYRFVGSNSAGTNAFFVDASHYEKLSLRGLQPRAWPCRVREARTSDGKLSNTTLLDNIETLGDLPVVRVDTLDTIRLSAAVTLV